MSVLPVQSMNLILRAYRDFQKSAYAGFIFGAVPVVIVLALNLFFKSFFQNYLPMSLFISAIVISSWIGGKSAGLLATLLGALAECYFFIEPKYSFILTPPDRIRLTIYILEGVVISLIIGKIRKIKRRISEAQHDLAGALANEKAARLMTEEAVTRLRLSQKLNEEAREEAEELTRIKTLFLANMSHEIRSPLTAMLGFTELLKEPNLSTKEHQHYVEKIESAGINLTEIINDILDISKVEANRLEIEKVSFSPQSLLAELYSILILRCREKSLELKFEQIGPMPILIKTDPLRLRQVILNVVGNAIKFTKSGFVKVKYESYDSKIQFTVEDTGIGITLAQQEKLFKNFSQGDSSISREYAGTGLGLSLSRRLAKILGGDVVLEKSTPGKGSVFSINISFEPAELESERPSEQKISVKEYSEFEGKKVLLVDDSEDNLFLMDRLLQKCGFRVIKAIHGKEALAYTSEQTFDLILMDMQMPVMDGYSASEQIRKNKVTTPIIALTANAMTEDREKCLRAGCSDYVSKPIQKAILIQTLLKNLEISQSKIIASNDTIN